MTVFWPYLSNGSVIIGDQIRSLSMKSFIFRFYVLISILVGILAIIILYSVQKPIDWRLIITIVGGVLSAIFLVQKQKLEETKLLKDLFTEFNERYSSLNEKLNEILSGNLSDALKQEEKDVLYKYFNLCAEEYLFHDKGYIPKEVWASWINGMTIFFENQRICALWKDEDKTGSYYGFKPPACNGLKINRSSMSKPGSPM
jgi:hypothetical protein